MLVGTVKKGTMKKGQESDLLGYGKKIKTSISGMQVRQIDILGLVCESRESVPEINVEYNINLTIKYILLPYLAI